MFVWQHGRFKMHLGKLHSLPLISQFLLCSTSEQNLLPHSISLKNPVKQMVLVRIILKMFIDIVVNQGVAFNPSFSVVVSLFALSRGIYAVHHLRSISS